ncbi:hypothetical protein WA158_007802 [Blastocystis sp. Blastoise]
MSCTKEALDFVTFLKQSSSHFHAIQECVSRLEKSGYQRLRERESWSNTVKNGGKYFFTRNQTSLFAFAVGKLYEPGNGFSIAASHCDSPYLKLKPISKIEKNGVCECGVEVYDSAIWTTWLDRDLGLAGRIFFRKDDKIQSQLIDIHKPIFHIPNLAVHMSDSAIKTEINKENHLIPILRDLSINKNSSSSSPSSSLLYSKHDSELLNYISSSFSIPLETMIDFELYLYDIQGPSLTGLYDEYICSQRLDNLTSAYASLEGLIQATNDEQALDNEKNIRMICIYDNEEIGSTGMAGAQSNSLSTCINRLVPREYVPIALNKSFIISADMSHAVHPNYSDKCESRHNCYMNKGIVLKHSVNMNYATNCASETVLRDLCMRHQLPLQEFVVRQDSRSGGTIGKYLTTINGIETVDVGLAMLSMHSIREMCGSKDISTYINMFKYFLEEWGEMESNIILGDE